MPGRQDHAKDAGAAAAGEKKSSRNAVSAAPSTPGAVPQTADYADYEMERAVLACILSEPSCINTVSTMLGVRQRQSTGGKAAIMAAFMKGSPHTLRPTCFMQVMARLPA